MLSIQRVTMVFDETAILHDITATITPGDFVVIVGHNGSGKSTLLEVISGAVKPQSGTLLFNNVDITMTSAFERMRWMGLLYQNVNRGVINTMTVAENIALARLKNKPVGLQHGFAQVQPYLDEFQRMCPDIDIKRKPVGRLSGGQRQVLAFYMATMTKPQLLLCDEPTAALDPHASDRMMENIKQFAQTKNGMTIMVTHELDDAIAYGNRLWIMKQGRLAIMMGSEKRFLTREMLQELLK